MYSNCSNRRIRSKKGKKYFYCTLWRRETRDGECIDCENKVIKKIKSSFKRSKIKGKKHKQTKATDISTNVKEAVWERDAHRCIFCNKEVPKRNACCHFIPRSAGGLGVEKNIFTACENCHREQDNGLNTKVYDKMAEDYLKTKYDDWNKEELVYRKY